MNKRLLSYGICAGMMLAGGVSAQTSDMQWQVYGDFGAAFESNPTKTDECDSDSPASCTDPTADTRVRGGIGGRLFKDGDELFVLLDYRARYDTWVDGTFDDRSTLEGFGEVDWQPVDWFAFFANNRRQDLIVDNSFADTQNNRSVRSVMEVGTRFTARLGRVDSLNLSPVYRYVFYDSGTGVDSRRPGLLAFWRHRVSPTDEFRLNAFAERIDYQSGETEVNDVDRAQAFVSYRAELNRLSYEVQLGQTWVQGNDDNNAAGVDDEDNDYSGTLLRAFFDYDADIHLFQLRAYHDLTDTSIGLSDSTVGGIGYNPGDTNINQLALVTRTQVDARYNLAFAARVWNWSIGYRYDKQDVEAQVSDTADPARDEERHRAFTTLSYDMRRNLASRLYGNYYTVDFLDSPIGRKDDIYQVGLVFDVRLFKYGLISIGAQHEQRVTNGEPIINDYANNSVFADFRIEFPPLTGGGRRFGGFRAGSGVSSVSDTGYGI